MRGAFHWPLVPLLAVLLAACAQAAPTAAPTPTTEATVRPAPSGVAREPGEWVRQRIDAVSDLYRISSAGREVLSSLDVRQMRGQPGFFGSFGFRSWTGIGEAKPTPVVHELSHSYWGAFPITGSAHLSWDIPEGGKLSPARRQYREDAVRFLTQPPDTYEPLRQRLKNLPGLSSENLDPLYHNVDADIVSMVGGDLDLVPPILRKYWDKFLQPGPFFKWDRAVTWYLGLSAQQKKQADQYLGFQHLDSRQYRHLTPDEHPDLDAAAQLILAQEQRQRLWDFTEQFDLVAEDAEKAEDFKFWRRYLREIKELHEAHAGFLANADLPRAPEITRSFNFLLEIEGLAPRERASRLAREMQERPFIALLLPALGDKTLVELFSPNLTLPEAAAQRGIARFVERLVQFAPAAEHILAAGARSPEDGAAELSRFLPRLALDDREEADLFFQILLDADAEVARAITRALDKETKRTLLKAVPVLLRRLLNPSELAQALDITYEATPLQMTEGISLMVEHHAGNFRIDAPFMNEVNRVVARGGEREPKRMLRVLESQSFRMESFIYQHPLAAVAILSTDVGVTAELVKGSDPVVLPPGRFIYSLIFASPRFAAQIVEQLDSQRESVVVLESLVSIAYDKTRVEANSGLPISLLKDGAFLNALLLDKGSGWLTEKLGGAVALYRSRAQANEVSLDFLDAYRETLEAAADTLSGDARLQLRAVIGTVFGPES